MTACINRLRQREAVLEKAKGLADEFAANAINRGDFDQAMGALETANGDLPVLFDALINPTGDSYLVAEALDKVRRQIADTTKGDAP